MQLRDIVTYRGHVADASADRVSELSPVLEPGGQGIGGRNAAAFFASYLLSAFGYEFVFFITMLQLFNTTRNPVSVGFFAALTAFPKLFAPLFGVLSDRFKRETVFGTAALAVGILVVAMGQVREVSLQYALWFFIAFGLALIVNARTVLMAEILPGNSYINGNTGVLVTLNMTKLLAPLAGGLLVGVLPTAPLYVFAGSLYLLAVAASRLLDLPDPAGKPVALRDFLDQVRDALRYVRGNGNLRSLMLLMWSRGLFLGWQVSLYVVYVKSHLHETDFRYGLFMTVISLGSIVGAFLALSLSRHLRNLKVIVFGLMVNYAVTIALGFVHTFYPALVLIFMSFAAFYVSAIALHSVRDTSTISRIRGTVYGTVFSIGAPLSLASMLLGTWLARRYGVDLVYIVGGTLAMASMLLIVGLNKFNLK